MTTDTNNLQPPLRTTKNMQSTLSQTSSQDQNTEIQLSPKHNQRLEPFTARHHQQDSICEGTSLNHSLI